jgi:tetratricopeptide (TPR) repeat protein
MKRRGQESNRFAVGTLALVLACGCMLPVSGAAAEDDPVRREARMVELLDEFHAARRGNEPEQAREVIGRMAELDPEHPKVTIAVLFLDYRRKSRDEMFATFDALGTENGPGRLFGRGLLIHLSGDHAAAEPWLRRALEGYAKLGHAAGLATSHNNLGTTLQNLGRIDEAVAEMESALPYLEAIADRKSIGDVLSNLGGIEAERGRWEESLAFRRRALAIFQELGNVASEGTTWEAIGKQLLKAGRPAEAIDALERAVERRRAAGEPIAEWSSLRSLAEAHGRIGEPERALELLETAFSLIARRDDANREARTLRVRGELLLSLERYEEAAATLRSAIEKYDAAGDAAAVASAKAPLGRALIRIGALAEAGQVLRESVEQARRLQKPRLLASALTSLVIVCRSTGELSAALVHQEEALRLFRQDENAAGEIIALNNLGAIYYGLDDGAAALRYFEATLDLARRTGDRKSEARAQENAGAVLATEGRFDEGLRRLEAAIPIWQAIDDPRGLAFARFNAAGTLRQMQRAGEATAMLDLAEAGFRELRDPEGRILSLNLRGRIQRDAGRHAEALATYERALRLATEHGFRREAYLAHAGRGAVLEATGKLEGALAAYTSAIDLVESMRSRLDTGDMRMRFFAGRIDLYEKSLELRLKQKDAGSGAAVLASFDLAQRARARSLLESFAESRAALTLEPELAARERAMHEAIGELLVRLIEATDAESREQVRRALKRAEERLGLLEVELRRSAPRYSEIVYPRPDSAEEIRTAVLRPGEVLLDYFIGEELALVWTVTPETVTLRRLPPVPEIERLVERFLERVGRPGLALGGQAPGDAEARALAEAILPVGGLDGASRIVVAPDGPLHHFPFEALRRGDRYLVEDHEVLVVPSGSALRLMRSTRGGVAANGFLGVADPDAKTRDPRFPPLPAARQALGRIAGLFPEERRVILSGAGSTEPALLAQPLDTFRYLHFATHAWLDAEAPRRSGLLLAGSESADGFLYRDEVLGLDLASEVVVLAACRSGVGELLRGEGLLGLTRAFLYAGARSVVVSLWNVSDRSTARFMEAFYAELTAGKSVPAALRAAKLRFIRSESPARRQPYHWAPFVIVGDPGS